MWGLSSVLGFSEVKHLSFSVASEPRTSICKTGPLSYLLEPLQTHVFMNANDSFEYNWHEPTVFFHEHFCCRWRLLLSYSPSWRSSVSAAEGSKYLWLEKKKRIMQHGLLLLLRTGTELTAQRKVFAWASSGFRETMSVAFKGLFL